jgi:peptidoglycan L-alanyl-D-glutamate endopeptidase CwlK
MSSGIISNTISASVGKNGLNKPSDVIKVQVLLKSRNYNPGPIDGICGKKTINAIIKFQTLFLALPDGIIDPNGRTWKKLTSTESYDAKISQIEWSGNSAQWTQEKKLSSLHPDLRPKIEAVISALKERGFEPKIFYGWRSVEVQLSLYNKGASKVKFSFHNAQMKDGTPRSYAADIIDRRFSWSKLAESAGFWEALGEEAKKQGLVWGGSWTSFKDVAHVQLLANSELAKVKKESGL